MALSYRLVNDDNRDKNEVEGQGRSGRGRHLRAARVINKNDMIFIERPLLSLQSLGNANVGALTCRRCRCFIGGPNLCLDLASGGVSRENAFDRWRQLQKKRYERGKQLQQRHGCSDTESAGGYRSEDDFVSSEEHFSFRIVPCRKSCGELFCSEECEMEMWHIQGHSLLCTGCIPESEALDFNQEAALSVVDVSPNGDAISRKALQSESWHDKGKTEKENCNHAHPPHPLLRFKLHAVRCNEILLLVADLVATVVCMRKQQIMECAEAEMGGGDGGGKCASPALLPQSSFLASSQLDDVLAPFMDFTMVPWWEVASAPLLSSPRGFAEAAKLDKTLRCLCDESSRLLREAMFHQASRSSGPKDEDFTRMALLECVDAGLFTGDFFGRVVGSFEQNAIGIRARHPLCRDVFNRTLREDGVFHNALIGCIAAAGMIGEDNGEGGDDDGDGARIDGECEGDDRNGGARDEGMERSERCFGGDSTRGGVENRFACSEEEVKTIGSSVAAAVISDDEYGTEDAEKQKANTHSDLEECDYDLADIALFLAKLDIRGQDDSSYGDQFEEHGDEGNRVRPFAGDDLDAIFPPLDGTAMFSVACKMNHSCDPNVFVRYRVGWGSRRPLVLQAVATRDIEEGEELCISYVRSEGTLEERQREIENYGFVCDCPKCVLQQAGGVRAADGDIVGDVAGEGWDVFGEDDNGSSSEDDGGESRVYFGKRVADSQRTRKDVDATNDSDAEALLRAQAKKFSRTSLSSPGRVPKKVYASAASFVVRESNALGFMYIQKKCSNLVTTDAEKAMRCVERCVDALEMQDLYEARDAGGEGELLLRRMLLSSSPSLSLLRKAYCCSSVAAALGLANEGMLGDAMTFLDRAMIFGLPREEAVQDFIDYVEFCVSSYHPPSPVRRIGTFCIVPDYRKRGDLVEEIKLSGLSGAIRFPMREVKSNRFDEERFVAQERASKSKALVVRGYADRWPAIEKWRDLNRLSASHGHRLVPIELGGMSGESHLREKIVSMRFLVKAYLTTSCERGCWSLRDAIAGATAGRAVEIVSKMDAKPDTAHASAKTMMGSNSTLKRGEDECVAGGGRYQIAYLAQHPLFEQIPQLREDVLPSPPICGEVGPMHRNVWIGTGGTRTPLHWDSYDNFFVQIVGVKYVRVYGSEESDKLYVIKKSCVVSNTTGLSESVATEATTTTTTTTTPSYAKQGNMSAVDCEIDDALGEDNNRHPLAIKAKFTEALLLPGDAVFIPSRAWHYVRAITTSCSVNYWF